MEVEIAETFAGRLTGLIGRRPDSGRALHLPGTRSVHTIGVRGRIDLIWVDPAGAVVRVDHAVPPGRLRSCRRAASVYECAEGEWRSVVAQL